MGEGAGYIVVALWTEIAIWLSKDTGPQRAGAGLGARPLSALADLLLLLRAPDPLPMLRRPFESAELR